MTRKRKPKYLRPLPRLIGDTLALAVFVLLAVLFTASGSFVTGGFIVVFVGWPLLGLIGTILEWMGYRWVL